MYKHTNIRNELKNNEKIIANSLLLLITVVKQDVELLLIFYLR